MLHAKLGGTLIIGAEGKSAYEIAVKNGFVGTETEWLASLKGKSAYEYAKAGGFPGTEDEFADKLAGEYIKTVNGIAPDENGNVEVEAGGVTDAEKSLILTLFRNAAYTAPNMADTLAQLEELWCGGGGEEPDVPEEPDEPVTLTSISVVYSGGDVAVGTAVTDLTGIVVTAHYSDGSTATVTGYTLIGTIEEGSNTITVSYGGKTTTFAVTGVAQETDPDETSFTPTWTENTYINIDGTISPYDGWYLSNEIDCSNYSVLRLTTESVKWFATPPAWGNTAKAAETGFVKITPNSDNNPSYMGGSYSKEVWFDVSDYECVRLHTNTDGVYNNTAVTYKLEV